MQPTNTSVFRFNCSMYERRLTLPAELNTSGARRNSITLNSTGTDASERIIPTHTHKHTPRKRYIMRALNIEQASTRTHAGLRESRAPGPERSRLSAQKIVRIECVCARVHQVLVHNDRSALRRSLRKQGGVGCSKHSFFGAPTGRKGWPVYCDRKANIFGCFSLNKDHLENFVLEFHHL